jgi:hypothetical protein
LISLTVTRCTSTCIFLFKWVHMWSVLSYARIVRQMPCFIRKCQIFGHITVIKSMWCTLFCPILQRDEGCADTCCSDCEPLLSPRPSLHDQRRWKVSVQRRHLEVIAITTFSKHLHVLLVSESLYRLMRFILPKFFHDHRRWKVNV